MRIDIIMTNIITVIMERIIAQMNLTDEMIENKERKSPMIKNTHYRIHLKPY